MEETPENPSPTGPNAKTGCQGENIDEVVSEKYVVLSFSSTRARLIALYSSALMAGRKQLLK